MLAKIVFLYQWCELVGYLGYLVLLLSAEDWNLLQLQSTQACPGNSQLYEQGQVKSNQERFLGTKSDRPVLC